MQNPIARALSAVTLGTPITRASLTMVPLIGPPTVEQEPFYLTLEEAIAQTWMEVAEVSERGRAPELRITNRGAKPVFMLDGEEFLGGKHDCSVNLSILVPAASEVVIPVSCVEAGRWRSDSHAFSAALRMQDSARRARRMAHATLSMQVNKYCGDRADASAKAERMGAHTPTSAMEEMSSVHQKFTERCAEELRPVEYQCGALFMIDGVVVGFDLFDNAVTLRRLLPKLVRSVAFDAMDGSGEPKQKVESDLTRCIPGRFLKQVVTAPVHAAKALGVGEDIRILHPDLAGGALGMKDGTVHLAAFAV